MFFQRLEGIQFVVTGFKIQQNGFNNFEFGAESPAIYPRFEFWLALGFGAAFWI